MQHFEGLPDSRTSLRGLTADGDEAWLIRSISQKLYRCPGCGRAVEIGMEHVIVQTVKRLGGTEHQHWHRSCAEDGPMLELRQLRPIHDHRAIDVGAVDGEAPQLRDRQH